MSRGTRTRYRRSVGPEQGGGLALPHGEVGLGVIALVGRWRFAEQRSVPASHHALGRRGLGRVRRAVTDPLYRPEELLSLRPSAPARLRRRLVQRGQAVRAIEGRQPDVGHEVRWVLRAALSREVARRAAGRTSTGGAADRGGDGRVRLLRGGAQRVEG